MLIQHFSKGTPRFSHCGLDDALVGLVGDHVIDVGCGQTGGFKRVADHFRQQPRRHFIDLAPAHLDFAGLFFEHFGRWRAAAAAAIDAENARH